MNTLYVPLHTVHLLKIILRCAVSLRSAVSTLDSVSRNKHKTANMHCMLKCPLLKVGGITSFSRGKGMRRLDGGSIFWIDPYSAHDGGPYKSHLGQATLGPNEQSSCFPQFPTNLEGGDFPVPFSPCQVAPGRLQDAFTHLAFLESPVAKNFVFSRDG